MACSSTLPGYGVMNLRIAKVRTAVVMTVPTIHLMEAGLEVRDLGSDLGDLGREPRVEVSRSRYARSQCRCVARRATPRSPRAVQLPAQRSVLQS